MLGGVAAVILVAIVVLVSAVWVDGITKSDGRCDPGADCENCPFPCENHNNKPSRK